MIDEPLALLAEAFGQDPEIMPSSAIGETVADTASVSSVSLVEAGYGTAVPAPLAASGR